MAGALDNKQVLVKIFIGIFVGILGISMLMYLVPQGPGTGTDADASDVVAKIGDVSGGSYRDAIEGKRKLSQP